MEVFYDRGCYFVGFSNEKEHEKELSCKVNELFDLSGMWVVDFDTLARKSEAYKASYENDRRELSNKMSNLRHANKHWARMYGVEELDRLIDEVEKGGLLFIR